MHTIKPSDLGRALRPVRADADAEKCTQMYKDILERLKKLYQRAWCDVLLDMIWRMFQTVRPERVPPTRAVVSSYAYVDDLADEDDFFATFASHFNLESAEHGVTAVHKLRSLQKRHESRSWVALQQEEELHPLTKEICEEAIKDCYDEGSDEFRVFTAFVHSHM